MSNHPQTSTWTEDRRRVVANLLREGMSAGQIAECLDVSRSAIVSIVHRDPTLREIGFARSLRRAPKMQLAPLPCQKERPAVKSRPAPVRLVKPEPVAMLVVEPVEPKAPAAIVAVEPALSEAMPEPLGLPLLPLNGRQCRFAVNNATRGEQHLFCGHPVKPGKSYCAHHYGVVYEPRTKAGAA